MCVVSMVMEHKWDEWYRRYPITVPLPPWSVPAPQPPMPTREEIEEFRRLLERAREYDKRTGQPDCEMEEKRQKLKELADLLGVKIDFL